MRDPEFQDNLDFPSGQNAALIDSTESRRRNPWMFLCRGLEVVLYILILLAVARLFWPEVDRQRALQAELERLNQIREDKQEVVALLRQEHNLLKSDQDYLENISRDRLNLQKENEYIIRLERE